MRTFFVFVVAALAAAVFPIMSQDVQQSPCGEGLVQIVKPGDGRLLDTSCVTPDIAERFSTLGWQIVTPGEDIVPSMATEEVEAASEVAEEMAMDAEAAAEEVAEETSEVAEEVATDVEEAVEEVAEGAEEVAEETGEVAEEAVADVEEATGEVVEETSEVVEEAAEDVEEVVEEAATGAEEVAEETGEVAEEAVADVEEATEEVAEETSEVVEEAAEDVEEVAEEAVVAAASTDSEWQDLGETTYGICASCHQATGEGLPSFYPALANHLPNVEAKEGGRKYIINVVLYGLSGQIETLGETYNGIMAPWNAMLSDEEIAAVLNHELHSWGNDDMLRADFTPITPEEVAAERAESKTAEEVYELRSQLGLTADE